MSSETPSYSQLGKGAFLIASPEIESGIFFRSVVILCEHSHVGSLGLIINKEIDFEISDQIIEVEELANPNVELRAGGPLQMNQMLILHNQQLEQCKELAPNIFLGGDLEFLQETMLDPEGASLRLMFGYASWASGQLEKEFLDGEWFVGKGNHCHIFETPVDQIWRSTLHEMGGKYSSLSMIPDDLSLN